MSDLTRNQQELATALEGERVQVLAEALRQVRDRNKARGGLFDPETQAICRGALKAAGVQPEEQKP